MPCFHPLQGWRGRGGGPAVFVRPVDYPALVLELPCGQCIGCRLERSRQWAVRCMHEASLHDLNCFITCTYDEAHLPENGDLVKRDFQLFLKRLRKRTGPFRYFHCGEYGARLSRPHYHACLFGYDFFDCELYRERDGVKLYTAPLLTETWGLGMATVGALTFESAAYCARYVVKKVTGKDADLHYGGLPPEYVTMSRGGRKKGPGGLGARWFERFSSEVYPCDEVIARGHPCRPPRFYDNLFELAEPSVFDAVKRRRVTDVRKHAVDCTPERLRVREVCTEARMATFRRSVEEG